MATDALNATVKNVQQIHNNEDTDIQDPDDIDIPLMPQASWNEATTLPNNNDNHTNNNYNDSTNTNNSANTTIQEWTGSSGVCSINRYEQVEMSSRYTVINDQVQT